MDIQTERLILRATHLKDVERIMNYYLRNQEFLAAFEPKRDEFFYSRAYKKMLVQASIDACAQGSELRYWIEPKDNPELLIGTIAFTHVIMGPFKSCYLGYKLDAAYLRQGYMYEGLSAAIQTLFEAYGLHRIEANIMPRNQPSLDLVKKLGFYEEGLGIKYLQINGIWEDHVHMVKRNPILEGDSSHDT